MSIHVQGMRAWLLQRLSSVYVALYLVFALSFFWHSPDLNYDTWLNFMAQPVMAISSLLFFIFILVHAWVGIRDVLIDYVHNGALRFSIFVILGLYLLTMGVWVLMILLSVVQI
ncbi:MAG: succinate dehydrogenase, hydrophobic membrane anchor protein [Gammaproteobacteria bacterium]|nr:succinate dehydrogenase, hydrophobic membrane anchor protein [Gammaproteobacteria bacterium]